MARPRAVGVAAVAAVLAVLLLLLPFASAAAAPKDGPAMARRRKLLQPFRLGVPDSE
jgi:hypothetical protein